ncbi:hypothetical protein [Chromobacterium amazonense]|uniref:hypothetical protein n=1 Tax=Chromobacterium amazonense TaxID=1382803 RepID=UPI0011B1E3AC|nr:hypothetical protein [Chromobacterium amazonense]
MFTYFDRLVSVRVYICVAVIIVCQQTYAAGNVFAYLNYVDNASTSSIESGSAAYGFCQIVNCEVKKTFIAKYGNVARISRGTSQTYSVRVDGQGLGLQIYTQTGARVNWSSLVRRTDVSYQIKIVGVGFIVAADGGSVDNSNLTSSITGLCSTASHHEFSNALGNGVAIWIPAGSSVEDCTININALGSNLQLKDLVVQYEESVVGLDRLASDHLAREDLSKRVQFKNGSLILDVIPAINVRFKAAPYVRLTSAVAGQTVTLSELANGSLEAQASINLETNTAFSISVTRCDDIGTSCVMHHQSRTQSVPLEISAMSTDLQGCSHWFVLTYDTAVSCFPRIYLSDYRHVVNFKFWVSNLYARSMVGGDYQSNITITFDARL